MRRDRTAAVLASTAVEDVPRLAAVVVLRPVAADVPRLAAVVVLRPVAVVVPRLVALAVRRAAVAVLAVACTAATAVSPVARSRPGAEGRSPTTGLSGPAGDATTTRPWTRTGSIPGAVAVPEATVTDRTLRRSPANDERCG
ncbi:hypothetical protein GUI43_06432 [Micromonospora noduli]|nr:hypothetical protein GUI43_06432 [Micromonospora noduli]